MGSGFKWCQRWFLFPCVSALFLSCVSNQSAVHFQLEIRADKHINPDNNGIPSPSMIRFYELRSIDTFEKIDFWSLYDDTEGALGDDLIHKGKWVIKPGDTLNYSFLFEDGGRYLGIVVEFRDIEEAEWKLSIPLRSKKRFFIELNGIILQKAKAKPKKENTEDYSKL